MKYVVFYTASFNGQTSVGNIGWDGTITNMDSVTAVAKDIVDHLIRIGDIPQSCAKQNCLAITGWKEFPDEVTPEAEKEGVYKEGMETRYYMRDRTYVLRFNERADGDKYPVWVYEGKR